MFNLLLYHRADQHGCVRVSYSGKGHVRQDRENDPFHKENENLCGRNKAAPEAYSLDIANDYESENDMFSFCPTYQGSRKTAHCCLEKLRVSTISLLDSLNWLHWLLSSKRVKIFSSEKRSDIRQTTI